MYDYLDFKLLETMTNDELEFQISEAKENYIELIKEFQKLEQEAIKEAEENKTFPILPDLGLHTKQLHKVESYIRKAENLLTNLEQLGYYERVAKLRTKKTKIIKINRKVRL